MTQQTVDSLLVQHMRESGYTEEEIACFLEDPNFHEQLKSMIELVKKAFGVDQQQKPNDT
jgi:hypothetical protein